MMPSTEYEPLITSKSVSSLSDDDSSLNSKFIRPFRVKPILLVAACLVVTAVIIYVMPAQNSISGAAGSPEWVRMERSTSSNTNKNHAHTRIPTPWREQSLCDDDHEFIMSLALKQSHLDELDTLVEQVSDPVHSDTFHKYWSREDVLDYFAPSETATDAVLTWLANNDLTMESGKVTMNNIRNVIKVSLTCSEANELLNTQYAFYQNQQTMKQHLRVRNGDYSIPKTVYDHVDFISPTIRFPLERHDLDIQALTAGQPRKRSGRSQRKKADRDAESDSDVDYNVPKRLYSLYRMDDTRSKMAGEASIDESMGRQGVLSLIDQYYSDDDLAEFWDTFDVSPTATMERIPNGQPVGEGSEAELDTQTISSIGAGLYTYVYYVADDADPFLTFVDQMMDAEHQPMPTVVSISYGADEYELTLAYAEHVNKEFAKLALLGVSIFASAGDSGVRGDDEDCLDGTTFIASFPASSPYVTSVGGTQGGTVPDNDETCTGETAWMYTGGGFSTYFNTPKWQKTQVNGYLDSGVKLPGSDQFNEEARGFPDISAQAVDFIVVVGGEYYVVAGTSAAAPTVAGMVSLINYARLRAGKTSLGFLNPVLYGIYGEQKDVGYYFNDVTEGYNVGCEENNEIGFYAASGWDPLTGLGTPKFARLYERLLKYK